MNLHPRRLALVGLVALAAMAVPSSCITDDDSTLTIANRSSSPFTGVFIREADDEDLGSNRLPAPLMPGDELVIGDIDCDSYDVIVTTADVRCEVRSMDICFEDDLLVLDDADLSTCESLTGEPTPDPGQTPEPTPPY